MRLIDADLIAQQMRELPHEYSNKEQRARTGGIASCQEIVRDAPTIEPKQIIDKDYLVTLIQKAVYKRFLGLEDRPSGEWMEDENGLYCSECKERAFREYSEAMNNQSWYEDVPTKFCPNCGVRMKGADNETD